MHADLEELFEAAVRFGERLVALAETEPQLGAAGFRIAIEAAAGDRGHTHFLHQIARERDIIGKSERGDVGHDVVRAARDIACEAPALEDVEQAVAAALFAELSPIDDVRGSADYRRGAAREIVLRALRGALGEADAEIAA